jgi:putative transposase
MRASYPSDLSDSEWVILEPLVPAVKPGGRPRAHSDRELINAMLYVLRGGIAWRALPHDDPPWKTVYHSFRLWRLDGSWARINTQLRTQTRVRAGRSPEPSAAILDSQSAKTTEKGGLAGGTEPSA